MRRFVVIAIVCSVAPSARAAPDAEPGEDAHGIPAEIVEAVRGAEVPAIFAGATELDRKTEHKRVADRRNQRYAALRERFAKFDAHWKELDARKQVVDKAVADADVLAKDGKLDDARKLLEGVITPGARETAHAFVEARDFELPAVAALARITRDQHDWNAMFAARAAMRTRHRVEGDEAAVRLHAIAFEDQSGFIGYNQSNPSAWANGVVKAANDAAQGGVTLAQTFDTGLAPAFVDSSNGKLKPGDWVIMAHLSKLTVKGQQVSYRGTVRWRTPKECHQSTRISFIDDAGFVHYQDDCTYTEHSEKVSLDATMLAPIETVPPSTTLVGKLAAVGPHWKLTDAIVADTRASE